MITAISLALAAAALVWIVMPVLKPDAGREEKLSARISEQLELQSHHQMVLAGLRDLEDDRQTGKLDADDYQRLKDQLTAEAIDLMKKIDALERAGTGGPRKEVDG